MENIVHLLIHDNTDIDYQIMVVPREHLCKGPAKSLFCAITFLIIFSSVLHYRVTSELLKLFQIFAFTHLSSALNKGMIWWKTIYPHFLALNKYF